MRVIRCDILVQKVISTEVSEVDITFWTKISHRIIRITKSILALSFSVNICQKMDCCQKNIFKSEKIIFEGKRNSWRKFSSLTIFSWRNCFSDKKNGDKKNGDKKNGEKTIVENKLCQKIVKKVCQNKFWKKKIEVKQKHYWPVSYLIDSDTCDMGIYPWSRDTVSANHRRSSNQDNDNKDYRTFIVYDKLPSKMNIAKFSILFHILRNKLCLFSDIRNNLFIFFRVRDKLFFFIQKIPTISS